MTADSARKVPRVLLLTILLRVVLTAVAFGVTAWILGGVDLSGGVLGALWVSILFGLVNAVVAAIVLALPLRGSPLVLGLLAIVVNALMIELTDALTDDLTVDEFWWTAIWASIILSLVIVVLEVLLMALFMRRAGGERASA